MFRDECKEFALMIAGQIAATVSVDFVFIILYFGFALT